MAVPYCRDCEEHFPGGEGLKDGRCPSCAAIFEKGRAEAPPADEPADEEREGRGGILGVFRSPQPEDEKPTEEEE